VDCLDDNAVSAYIGRTLPEAERQRVSVHLSSCEGCLEIVCAAATTETAHDDAEGAVKRARVAARPP
jgi:hypothetical protein